MTTIDKLAKAQHLATALVKPLLKARNCFDSAQAYSADPFRTMEAADRAFEYAAEFRLYAQLHAHYEHVARETPDAEVTWDNIRDAVREEFKYMSPVGRSTSQSSNLMEQWMCRAVQEFCNTRMPWFFFDAQRMDPDYRAYMEEQNIKAKAALQAEQIRAAEIIREKKAEQRRLRRQTRGV